MAEGGGRGVRAGQLALYQLSHPIHSPFSACTASPAESGSLLRMPAEAVSGSRGSSHGDLGLGGAEVVHTDDDFGRVDANDRRAHVCLAVRCCWYHHGLLGTRAWMAMQVGPTRGARQAVTHRVRPSATNRTS